MIDDDGNEVHMTIEDVKAWRETAARDGDDGLCFALGLLAEEKEATEQLRGAARLYEPGKKVIQKAILYALYFAIDPNGRLAEMVRTELFEAVSEYPDRVVEVCIATGEEVKE